MDIILLLLVLAVIGYFVIQGYQEGRRGSDPAPPADTAFTWPALGDFDFEIVGESHYQPAIAKLAGNHGDRSPDTRCIATLIPETNNPHDRSAIRVDISGQTVGYFSREDARKFRRRLGTKNLSNQPTRCAAMIVGGYLMKNGTRASYGISLDIKPFN